MRARIQPRITMAILAVACTFALSPSAAAQGSSQPGAGSPPSTVPAELALRLAELSAAAGGGLRPTVAPDSGELRFLGTRPGHPIPVASGADAETRARAFLQAEAALFGLERAGELVAAGPVTADDLGRQRVRFRQEVDGVPVAGGEIGVHLDADGVVAVHDRTVPGLAGLDTRPTLPAEAARRRAAEVVRGRDGDLTGVELSRPRLEILDRAHLGGPAAPVRLAWFVEARSMSLRDYVWIDAATGARLLRFSQLPHARDRRVYDADDPGDGVYDSLPGALVRSEADGPSGDADVDDAFDFSGDTYDYFFSEHGRDSFDGSGGTLHSTVRFCPDAANCPYANAFWNGVQMVYGQGFPAADDVVAHELTHAVTERSADLFYYMQSGALNESFSDIFGETVDLGNGSGTDTAGVRWLMGEDVPGFGAIRDMMDPTTFGDPAKTSDYLCFDDYRNDRGGVHFNSGIPNHAYALMVDGGTYNSVVVAGIGLTKAGKVQYRALTEYLLTSSDLVDDAAALAQACLDLVGTAGITGGDCAAIDAAVAAVEMDDPPVCAPVDDPPLCGEGLVASDLFYDDFEELALDRTAVGSLSNWTLHLFAGLSHWGPFDLGPYAVSGSGNLYAYNRGTIADSAMAMSGSVALPAGAHAHFRHAHGFENSDTTYWDGGVIEYSLDGGTTWADAGALISAGEGYGGVVADGFGNPVGGRSAFVADSFGYTGTQMDLAALDGSSIRFRFRVGTDSVVDEYGWFIDDFRIYTCEGAGCVTALVLQLATVSSAEAHVGCDTITAGNAYTVAAGGDLSLTAPQVVLTDGFSVESGGKLTVVTN